MVNCARNDWLRRRQMEAVRRVAWERRQDARSNRSNREPNPALALALAWAGGAALACLSGAPDAAPWLLGAAGLVLVVGFGAGPAMVSGARWWLRRIGRRAAK